ncbi:diaminopimelate epimerase [soil metagenome]
MKFTKMHGIGNDYVYVDCFKERLDDPASISRAISDRHKGIGSDGLILIEPSKVADVRMRMFNADGSESEMCGNGVRCVAKYAFDHGLSQANPIKIETGRGVLSIAMKLVEGKVREATVDMGVPILLAAQIPVDESKLDAQLAGAKFVSMGNPHAVFFVNDVSALELNQIGPTIERHPAFPQRVNAHWVQVHSRDEVTMRTWKRGSGITQACGTGAAAVCVAGVLTNRTDRKILAHLPGGDLTLEWRESDNHVYKTGPAVEVFSGEWTEKI